MTAPSYDRKTVLGWSLYDFANSAYTTVIITFVYALFFKDFMMGEGGDGTTLWTRGATVTGIVVAVSSPYLGALADRGGIRRGLLLSSTDKIGSKRAYRRLFLIRAFFSFTAFCA